MHKDHNPNTAAVSKICGFLERLKNTHKEEMLAKGHKYGFNFFNGTPMEYEK